MKKSAGINSVVLPDNLVAQLLAELPPAGPAPSVKRQAAMKKRILDQVGKESRDVLASAAAADMHIVRADEGRWFNFSPQVQMKVLHDDGDTRTWLARFQAGGRIPSHTQTGDEEAIILEGWCFVGDDEMHKGDYQLIRKGARHGEIVSPEGCLIFVRSHSEKKHVSELAFAR